jgi:Mrp family chromosome partitioning ATPase/capsular polysaccharide biosynthesis protein
MNETTDAVAIFSPLWARKWLIVAAAILVAAATYGYYKRKPFVYKATTELYLSGGSGEGQEALTANGQGKAPLSDRTLSDQATLINSNVIGEAVHQQLRREHRPAAAHGKARASTATGSDFITITAEAHTSKAAAQLANAYAAVYVARQSADHRQQIDATLTRTRHQLRAIEAGAAAASARKTSATGLSAARSAPTVSSTAVLQTATLDSRIDQLESDLSSSGVVQISPAKPRDSVLISPTPSRNAIFGLLLGLVLASFGAYVVDRLDRRLRSLEDMESALKAQILTALPKTRAPIVHGEGQPAPAGPLLEPLRSLNTTLALGDMLEHDRERSPRVILFVSADIADGKSTLIANLALVQRDAGERVAVVEADLRRPALAGLLGVDGTYGLTEVLAGTLTVAEVMQSVGPNPEVGPAHPNRFPADPRRYGADAATVVQTPSVGSLAVLASGVTVTNPPALLARRTMTELLHSLAEEYDHVLIDAPSPLGVSDVMPLLRAVDGIVLVARAGHTRLASAQKLTQLLTRVASAPVLGIAAVGASRGDMRAHGFSSGYEESGWRRRLIGV